MKRLTEGFERLTESEKRVCNYIVQNYKEVADMNINDLAERAYASKTVVINMAQKLDFSGYTELRYYLKNIMSDKEEELLSPYASRDSVLKLSKLTGNIMNFDDMDRVAKDIVNARTVYVSARGTSKSCATHLSHLLLTMGVKCVLISDYNLLSITASKVERNELFILFSLSGETRKIIEAAEIVKARGAKVVGITSFSHNNLSRLADVNLYAATESTETLTDDDISRIGFFIVAEVLANQVKLNLK
ncbi:MAG TPA: MurR/RpiR family transcriptional regulator [Erysipelothrix sp.]